MLYQNGYLVGQYISIEKAIADTKDSYYDALARADQNWHEAQNDPTPFIKYMLGVLLSCYREFEDRVDLAEKTGAKSTAYDVVRHYAMEKLGKFTKQEVLMACPRVGASSAENALKRLAEEGVIEKLGAGTEDVLRAKRGAENLRLNNSPSLTTK